MKVWTHHLSTFPLTSPNLVIDATKSVYYRDRTYRDAIRDLHHFLPKVRQYRTATGQYGPFGKKCNMIS